MNPLWNDLAARAGLTLSYGQHAGLSRYLDLLLEANARMNLTRITDRAAADARNAAFFFVDSISTTPASGRTIASGIPGTPPPVPTSATRMFPGGSNGSSVSASPTCWSSAAGRSVMRVRFIRAFASNKRSR